MYQYGPKLDTSPRECHSTQRSVSIRVTRAQVEAARLLVQRGNHRPAIKAIAETRLPGER